MASSLLFSTIEVTRQVFYRSSLSYAIVNLKPIVPGRKKTYLAAMRVGENLNIVSDVLVLPNRPVPRLADLDDSELSSLMGSIRRVGSVIERAYGADGLTVACQDGKAAGQTIPHVHFHLLPRKYKGDRFSGNNDEVYPALEQSEQSLQSQSEPLKVDADDQRLPRTTEEMEREASWLRGFFDEECRSKDSD